MVEHLVSIIIPTFNRAELLGETLDSIIEQSYVFWECIVVDDGSTDDTMQLLKHFSLKDHRIRYYSRPLQRSKGPNSCRNYGYTKSRGQFIQFFDSDDIMLSHALEFRVRAAQDNCDAVICKTQQKEFNTGKILGTNTIHSSHLIEDYFCFEVTFYICGPLWNRAFLEKQDTLFDETIRFADDWDFNLRMLYQEPNLVFLDNVLFLYRWHRDSLSKEVRKLDIEEIKSDFKAHDKHLVFLRARKDVCLKRIREHIVKRYKRYFKWAMTHKPQLTRVLFKEIIKKELAFKHYFNLIKSIFGYSMFRFLKKGYIFFKD